MREGGGLGKGLETFPPRGVVPVPHRLALHLAFLVRSSCSGNHGTCPWSEAAALPACSPAADSSACRVPISNEHLLQLQPEQLPAPKVCDCLNWTSKCMIIKRWHGAGMAAALLLGGWVRQKSNISCWRMEPPRGRRFPHGERQDIEHPCIPPSHLTSAVITWTPVLGRYLAALSSPMQRQRVCRWGKKEKKKIRIVLVFEF